MEKLGFKLRTLVKQPVQRFFGNQVLARVCDGFSRRCLMGLIPKAAVLRKAGSFLILFCLTARRSSQALRNRRHFILKAPLCSTLRLPAEQSNRLAASSSKSCHGGKKQIAQLKLLRQTDCQEDEEEEEQEEGLSAWETEERERERG